MALDIRTFDPIEATIAMFGGREVVDAYPSHHVAHKPIASRIAMHMDEMWAAWMDLAYAARAEAELVAELALGSAIEFDPEDNPFLAVASPVWAKP